jgi:hypothetical protein
MSKGPRANPNAYVPLGAIVGLFVGLIVYWVTGYLAALGFGVLFGVAAAMLLASSRNR